MRFRQLVAAAAVMLAQTATQAIGQPTELTECTPTCQEGLQIMRLFDCEPVMGWVGSVGRQWYGPLRAAGTIQVSVQARPFEGDIITLPLFIELRMDLGPLDDCRSISGNLVWETRGSSNCDSTWVTSPPIDLTHLLGDGTTYWVQLEGFATWDSQLRISAASPGTACVRVTSVGTSVVATTWSHVRKLYD